MSEEGRYDDLYSRTTSTNSERDWGEITRTLHSNRDRGRRGCVRIEVDTLSSAIGGVKQPGRGLEARRDDDPWDEPSDEVNTDL